MFIPSILLTIITVAIRDVKPFDAKQWAKLMEDMKRGQTKKQAENLERAHREMAEKIKNGNVTFNLRS